MQGLGEGQGRRGARLTVLLDLLQFERPISHRREVQEQQMQAEAVQGALVASRWAVRCGWHSQP